MIIPLWVLHVHVAKDNSILGDGKLQSKEIRRKYNIDVKNRFKALGDIEDLEEEQDMILETYRDAAKKVIGWSKKQAMDKGQSMGKN